MNLAEITRAVDEIEYLTENEQTIQDFKDVFGRALQAVIEMKKFSTHRQTFLDRLTVIINRQLQYLKGKTLIIL